jgi:hypothetical protein
MFISTAHRQLSTLCRGQAGFHQADTASPIAVGTSAYWSAQTALGGRRGVYRRAYVYALAAHLDTAWRSGWRVLFSQQLGNCSRGLLLSAAGRPAILDIDVHPPATERKASSITRCLDRVDP